MTRWEFFFYPPPKKWVPQKWFFMNIDQCVGLMWYDVSKSIWCQWIRFWYFLMIRALLRPLRSLRTRVITRKIAKNDHILGFKEYVKPKYSHFCHFWGWKTLLWEILTQVLFYLEIDFLDWFEVAEFDSIVASILEAPAH